MTASAFALSINDPAPLFSLRDSNNKYFHLSNYVNPSKENHPSQSPLAKGGSKGGAVKGIILNFFASYCKPCKNELPVLNSLVDEFEKKGIKIVIVGYGEDFDKINEMLSKIKVDKPIILSDVYSRIGAKYGVNGLPHTVFIGSDGKIKDIIKGELPDIEKVLREKTGKLLK
ncbi:MAG: TlpA disulfide reductase family protein [Thermodesulfovibrionales bacterium]|nr:TlpA disulfide reductase family protein [Thermodesulfovibrionales bacterium]